MARNTTQIALAVSIHEREFVERRAREAGLSMNAWVRNLIRAAMYEDQMRGDG
jgi:ribosomal protein L32E